jgi:hypothetical protein
MGTTILEFFKTLMEFVMFWKRKKAGDVIVKTAEIYDEMRKVVLNYDLGVHRFLIIKAHNGGGDFRNDTMTYATVLHEEIRKPIISVKGDYQGLPIDGYYNEMLKKVYMYDEFYIDASTMKKESLLGTIYDKEKIKHAKVFFLKHSKKGFWFCSIATTQEDNKLNAPEQTLAFKIAVSKIKQRL